MIFASPLCRIVLAVPLLAASAASGTWSIVICDTETREIAVGTVTCLTNFDLLAIVPVVVVGEGGGAVQSAGDFDGIRRPVIFEQLMLHTPPADILAMLESFPGHQQRQYGIVDTRGGAVTFSGASNGAWAGGVVGSQGTMFYAIQGNVLTGECVINGIESRLLQLDGDVPSRLMAGMLAARQNGGYGRCSCSPSNPPGCGCPPAFFNKSGHIGGMIVARIGDEDDAICRASGCADGDYFMRMNVAFQSVGQPDPVLQLQLGFNAWRADHAGRPDAIHSTVAFDPPVIPSNGVATSTMRLSLLDWEDAPIDVSIDSVVVEHSATSAGLSVIGDVVDNGDGTVDVTLIAGRSPGADRFVVTVDDGIRPVVLMPEPTFVYHTAGDLDGSGAIGLTDLLGLLATWGDCPEPPAPCLADLDGDGAVGLTDLLTLIGNWG